MRNATATAPSGVLHARWNPLPGRFKDYVAMPKFNLYQSLHTTVLGPDSKPVEFQIRTQEMHRQAEYGVAAHWKYKEGKGGGPPGTTWPGCGRSPTGSGRPRIRASSSTRCGSRSTPPRCSCSPRRGTCMSLPPGSTPIDFAYAVHTEVGHRTVGARVNERLVPLEYELNNGDQVEVLTSKATTPDRAGTGSTS